MPDTYSFRPGPTPPGLTAEEVHAALEAIRTTQPNQDLSAEVVVTVAADPRHPLHEVFEWRDDVAAVEYRLSQSRRLLRSVYIQRDDRPPTPVYYHIERHSYQPIDVVVTRLDLFELALTNLHQKLQSADRSVRELESAAKTSANPDRLEKVAQIVAAVDVVREALAVLK